MHENKAIFFLVKRQNYAAQDNTNKKLEFSMKYSKIKNEKPFFGKWDENEIASFNNVPSSSSSSTSSTSSTSSASVGKKRSKR